jgi:hypothetical protein
MQKMMCCETACFYCHCSERTNRCLFHKVIADGETEEKAEEIVLAFLKEREALDLYEHLIKDLYFMLKKHVLAYGIRIKTTRNMCKYIVKDIKGFEDWWPRPREDNYYIGCFCDGLKEERPLFHLSP